MIYRLPSKSNSAPFGDESDGSDAQLALVSAKSIGSTGDPRRSPVPKRFQRLSSHPITDFEDQSALSRLVSMASLEYRMSLDSRVPRR